MMIPIFFAFFFLFATDWPSFDSEFEEFQEFEELIPEVEFSGDLIAAQDNQAALISFVNQYPQTELSTIELAMDLTVLLKRHVKAGSTVIDYGAGNGSCALYLSDLVGAKGKVFAFEQNINRFRELYWNLLLSQVHNAQLYCIILGEKDKTLDALRLDNVSLIKIDAHGREDIILRGAQETINKCRPVLIFKMLGGIPIEKTDRFLRQEFYKRLIKIQEMGYSMQRINENEYLALPIKQ